MAKTRWLTPEQLAAWKHFSMMQLQLFALIGRELADTDLSWPDYVVLAALSDDPTGRVRMGDLGRGVGWEKSRISHHISRMEQRGLVARSKCPTDQRGWFVSLTDDGRRAIEAAAPGHVAVVRKHFVDLLSPAQIATLDEIATTVLKHLPPET